MPAGFSRTIAPEENAVKLGEGQPPVADVHGIPGIDCIVHPRHPLVVPVFGAEKCSVVVVPIVSQAEVGKRNELQDLGSHRIDPVGRNAIPRKGISHDLAIDGSSRCRIVDGDGQGREVATAHGCGRDNSAVTSGRAFSQAFVGDHEKQLVPPIDELWNIDRPPHLKPKGIVDKVRLLLTEGIQHPRGCRQSVVFVVFPQ